MEKYSAGYVLNAAEFRQASEDIGLYAGSLSLALLGASPDTLHASPRFAPATASRSESHETVPSLAELEALSRQESLHRLARLSLHGSTERFTKQDMV